MYYGAQPVVDFSLQYEYVGHRILAWWTVRGCVT